MKELDQPYLDALETHSLSELRAVFQAGMRPDHMCRGRTLFGWVTEMSKRSPSFSDCVHFLLDQGVSDGDEALELVLLNDGPALTKLLKSQPTLIDHRVSMRCAFTPLDQAPLLHVAAEFVCLESARALLETGAPVDEPAGRDKFGLGGQTALFHTVNSNADYARDLRELLLAAGADPERRVNGIVWGRDMDWETSLFDLTPISYAQLGLLPQMHRQEGQVRDTVLQLLAAADRSGPTLRNVPNKYLKT